MKKKITMLLSITTVIFTLNLCKRQNSFKNYIKIKGSDTMVHMAASWAEKYSKLHKEQKVSVTGGGSGTGIAALINKTTDIASASRKMKAKEIQNAAKQGIIVKEYIVARDGIALVVNPKNPVFVLSLKQLKNIFTGSVKNWKEVGGENSKILVLSRESSSGTFVFFQEHVLNKEDYSPKARLMPATSSLIQVVSGSEAAIAYVGLGYALKAGKKVKIISVKDKNGKIVQPSFASVKNGTYSISRPLQLYTNREAKGNIKSFIDFVFSEQGQKIVSDSGYIRVK